MRFVRYSLAVICLVLGGLGAAAILGALAHLPDAVFWAIAPVLGLVLAAVAPLGPLAFPVAVGVLLVAGAFLLLGPGRVLVKAAYGGAVTVAFAVPIWALTLSFDWAYGGDLPAWAAWCLDRVGAPHVAPASWLGWARGVTVAALTVGATLLVYVGFFLLIMLARLLVGVGFSVLPTRTAPVAPTSGPPPFVPAPAKFWRGRRID